MLNSHFDEIRSKLDNLNALSDSINSLERQFDEANSIFRETLKCSTDRLSNISRTLGNKSIRYGRIYNAAKITVEQNQSECQRACVQFEQANNDHQSAKEAILDAEHRLKEITKNTSKQNGENNNSSPDHVDGSSLDLEKLRLTSDETLNGEEPKIVTCDREITSTISSSFSSSSISSSFSTILKSSSLSSSSSSSSKPEAPKPTDSLSNNILPANDTSEDLINAHSVIGENEIYLQKKSLIEGNTTDVLDTHQVTKIVSNAAKLSEQLNQAVMWLDEAEKRREQSEKQHLDCANRLMLAKENLLRLEREYGQSIKRSQLYFDEAKRFNAKLDSVKRDICRISKDILAAKKAYAQTLSELEQFSEDLHAKSTESSKRLEDGEVTVE